ncbi:hypothetical protein [Nevskia sp.]|uniref:lipopolysaccharide biosynthesis protein n=1 Tax=Nevskia sp. TaxID=1929292 RepID=UPI0025D73237|nr:hypothetical protein [Nevskia sp.]
MAEAASKAQRQLDRALGHAGLARVGSVIAVAGAHVLAVRALGPAVYGDFVFAESLVFALNLLAIFGSHISVFAIGSRERPATARTMLTAAASLIGGWLLLELLLLALAQQLFPHSRYADPAWLWRITAAVAGMSLYRVIAELIRIEVGVALANYFSGRGNGFVASLWLLPLLVLALATGTKLDALDLLAGFAIAQWLGVLIGLAFLLPALRQPPPATALRHRDVIAEMLRRGRSITITQIAQLTVVSLDVWLLAMLAPAYALGVYGLAKRFATWLIVPVGLVGQSALKHAVAEFREAGRISAELEAAFRRAVLRSWWLVASLVVIAAVLPASWLQAIAGPTAVLARPFFVALGLGQLLRLAFGNGGMILSAAGLEAENLRAYLVGNGAALVAALAIIPIAGPWGAVAAYSTGTVIAAVLVSRACKRRMDFHCDLLGQR